jgi:hypothetical protein
MDETGEVTVLSELAVNFVTSEANQKIEDAAFSSSTKSHVAMQK